MVLAAAQPGGTSRAGAGAPVHEDAPHIIDPLLISDMDELFGHTEHITLAAIDVSVRCLSFVPNLPRCQQHHQKRTSDHAIMVRDLIVLATVQT